jgi:hypothetical protein
MILSHIKPRRNGCDFLRLSHELLSTYYLKHEQCFIRYKNGATAECFISDKARIASVLNGLKNDPSYEFIREVILKINVV